MSNTAQILPILQTENFITQEEFKILILSTSIVLFILLITVIILFIVFQRRKIKFLVQQNEAEKNYIEELAKTRIEIQENTLKNVSWELHDNIGQLLSVANMQLNRDDDSLNSATTLSEVKELVSTSLQEIRSLSKSLNNEVIENLGLIDSIKNDLERFERLNFLETKLEVIGTPFTLPQNDAIILFRIVQEFFNNVIKHAKASQLVVKLVYNNKSLEVIINDNGVGFDADRVKKNSGLINMQSRAKLVGAQFTLQSTLQAGTVLKIKYIREDFS